MKSLERLFQIYSKADRYCLNLKPIFAATFSFITTVTFSILALLIVGCKNAQPISTGGMSNLGPAPIITSASCPRYAYADEPYNCVAQATPTNVPPVIASGLFSFSPTITWSLQNNPCVWLSINNSSGVLSGTPDPASDGNKICDFEIVASQDGSPSIPWRVHLDVVATGVSSKISMIDAGSSHTCGVHDGNVGCWGSNAFGALGHNVSPGDLGSTYVALMVEDSSTVLIRDITQVSSGADFSCARNLSGSVFCWGRNDHGQLADNTTTTRHGAVPSVAPLTGGVSYVSAGLDFACALMMTSGEVKCWGSNSNGQIGNNGGSDSPPANVVEASGVGFVSISDAIQIVTGDNHACALMKDRTIKCWGSNSNGQLGQESTVDSSTAVTVNGFGIGFNEAVSISANANGVCALLVNGEVKCWGSNSFGELGLGYLSGSIGDESGEMTSLASVSLDYSNGIKSLSGGASNNCVLLSDSTVRCWGNNYSGQVGIGDAFNTKIGDDEPVSSALVDLDLDPSPSSATIPIEITVGGNHVCARVFDSNAPLTDQLSIVCWGENSSLQLGYYDSPVSTDDTIIGDGPSEMGSALASRKIDTKPRGGHIIFATSATFNGNLDEGAFLGRDGADKKCQDIATARGFSFGSLGDTSFRPYRALLSSTVSNAYTRLSSGVGPILNMAGETVANTYGDLFGGGGILKNVRFNEFGAVAPGGVWTGSGATGAVISGKTCSDWSNGSLLFFGQFGWSNGGLAQTISSMVSPSVCNDLKRLYCVGPTLGP